MAEPEERRVKRIDKDSAHQISSGTVIVHLATAVKELVENSLDAGATSIDIRLTESGADSIEVSDNGHGIAEEDFESFALRSHTSKIKEFDDLARVESFGFRGEAISALAALSELTVKTRAKGTAFGYELAFDEKGTMVKKTKIQCKEGTMVTIRNLFVTLPVRREQLVQNAKKEFAKLLRVLYGYGIISGARILCTSVTNGKSAVVMRTTGQNDMLRSIEEIFHSGSQNKLVPILSSPPTEDILAEFNLQESDTNQMFRFEGWISGCQSGSGRSANDRQFVFFNKRPCEYPKITKLISQVYREFNVKDHPFYAINILVERAKLDINVVPNKNQVLVQKEKLLLATLKASIRKTYGSTPSSIPLKQLPAVAQSSAYILRPPQFEPSADDRKLGRLPTSAPQTSRTNAADSFFSKLKFGAKKAVGSAKRSSNNERSPPKIKQHRLQLKKADTLSETAKYHRITDYLEERPVAISLDPPYDEIVGYQSGTPMRGLPSTLSRLDKSGFGPEILEASSVCGTPQQKPAPLLFSQFPSQNSQSLPMRPPSMIQESSFGTFNPVGFAVPAPASQSQRPSLQRNDKFPNDIGQTCAENFFIATVMRTRGESDIEDAAGPRPAPFIGFDDDLFGESARDDLWSPLSVICPTIADSGAFESAGGTSLNLVPLEILDDDFNGNHALNKSYIAPRLTTPSGSDVENLIDNLQALEEEVSRDSQIASTKVYAKDVMTTEVIHGRGTLTAKSWF